MNSRTPKKLRQLAPGVSLGELARRTGIRHEHLSRVVNGKRGLTLVTAQRIAKALDLSTDDVANALAS
jgi:plasmid maintenance system antidote protein VapI